MASSLIVELSQRVTRTLDLGKGMFFDADAMAVLVECGAVELIQKGAVDNLKERAAERLKAREARGYSTAPVEDRAEPAARRNRSPGQKPFRGSPASKSPSSTADGGDAAGPFMKLGGSTEAKAALERARRTLEGPSKRRTDNVTVLRPRQRG